LFVVVAHTRQEDNKSSIEGISVLLVDDELPILEAMESLLNQWNCQCHAFSTINEAEKSLNEKQLTVDLILCIQCIERLRHIVGEATPAALLSGDTSPDLLHQVQEAGYYLLHKPLKPAL